jgi:hypothetical protein
LLQFTIWKIVATSTAKAVMQQNHICWLCCLAGCCLYGIDIPTH